MGKKKVAKKKTAKKTTSKGKAKTAVPSAALAKRILFRPDRYQYVRKVNPEKGCVFCLAAQSKAPNFETLTLFQTKHSMLVLNKFPYNSGHLLVVPKGHQGDLNQLSQDQFHDLQELVRLAVKALKDVYQPAGINVGLNLGAAAGAGIPDHLHYHVIPRWAGDLNFFPLIAETKVVIETLETTFDRLLTYLNKKSES